VIRQRLRAYHELTGPILQWYGASASTAWMAECPRPGSQAIVQAVERRRGKSGAPAEARPFAVTYE